jgi:4'-phosphopantetheinyl transferase
MTIYCNVVTICFLHSHHTGEHIVHGPFHFDYIFHYLQCLKESYVKAVGIGIGFSLQRLSFRIKSLQLEKGKLTRDTVLFIDGMMESSWEFQETMIDDNHCAAVAVKNISPEVTVLI